MAGSRVTANFWLGCGEADSPRSMLFWPYVIPASLYLWTPPDATRQYLSCARAIGSGGWFLVTIIPRISTMEYLKFNKLSTMGLDKNPQSTHYQPLETPKETKKTTRNCPQTFWRLVRASQDSTIPPGDSRRPRETPRRPPGDPRRQFVHNLLTIC